jgi:predicted hydrolase (HD superfamily)
VTGAVKVVRPVKVFASERRVDEAVESVEEIVTGAEPRMVNDVQLVEPEHDAVVVAVVVRRPVDPTYAIPCERDESRSAEEIVDDAVEKKPERPRTVEVLLYPVFEVNGNV